MVEIPEDLARRATADRFRRGVVFRCLYEDLDDPNVTARFKFGIVLSLSEDPDILFVLTTSQLGFYADGRFDADILRIAAGKYPFFPKDTIVSLREVYAVDLARLAARYARGDLTFSGEIAADDLAEVEEKVRASRLIPPRTKARILP